MSENLHVVCPHCQAVNRLPASRLGAGPNCGGCHAPLLEPKPLALDQAALLRQMERGDLPLLVDFWAPWCGPCRNMAPAFEQAAGQLFPGVRLAKVNTDQEQALAGRLGIQSIPTMVLFSGGREKARTSGAMPAAGIVGWVRSQL
ncbi:MAG: thioredoxin TrxC [Pseudomonadota bacterium]